MTSKPVIKTAAALVFAICAYVFLYGNGVFEGTFRNELLAWYFLAKGIFCSVYLVLTAPCWKRSKRFEGRAAVEDREKKAG